MLIPLLNRFLIVFRRRLDALEWLVILRRHVWRRSSNTQ